MECQNNGNESVSVGGRGLTVEQIVLYVEGKGFLRFINFPPRIFHVHEVGNINSGISYPD